MILHINLLKQALENGLTLSRVTRGISFVQKAFLKTYIESNISRRNLCTNKMDKAFYKLANNSVSYLITVEANDSLFLFRFMGDC